MTTAAKASSSPRTSKTTTTTRGCLDHGHANFDGPSGTEFFAVEPLDSRLCCARVLIGDCALTLGGACVAIRIKEDAEFSRLSVSLDCSNRAEELGNIIF